jgi:hypothetical protein
MKMRLKTLLKFVFISIEAAVTADKAEPIVATD